MKTSTPKFTNKKIPRDMDNEEFEEMLLFFYGVHHG